MWKNKSGIQNEFLNKMILIIFVSIGLWCAIWIHYEYSNFKLKSESLRADHVQSQKIILKKEVSGVVSYINDMKIQAEQKLELALKERVYEAHDIAMNIYRQNADSKDIPEIIKMIKDALRPIRFNDGRGYYFAVSMEGIEQLYPVSPQFEGKNLMALQDSKGNFVIQDEIKIIKSKREGFVKHFWIKPDKDPSISYPKISFVKYFEPLDWYFGAGEYLDEAKKQIQDEVLNRLINLRFGTDGYFFGSTYKGYSLFSNGEITMGSGNIWDLTDPNGVKIIQEQIKSVENPAGGFVHYSWHKLNTPVPSPKISFVKGIPEWEWTIGAGVYLDTIETIILDNKTALMIGLQKRIFQSLLILAVLLCLVYVWSKRISNKIAKEIETFSFSLKNATTSAIVINPDDLRFREFKDIAGITNKMLASRKQAEYALEKTKEQYRLLVENQTDMIVKFDGEGLFQFVSPSYCRTFGKTRKELLGKSFMLLIHKDDQDNVKQAIKRVFKPPYTAHLEERALTKDGFRWQAWLNTAILDKDNQIESIVAVGRDIDDQKKIELALIKSEQQFRGLFNSITDLVYTQDLNGYFTSVNPAMQRLFGYDINEFVGHRAIEFMKPEFQSEFTSQYLEKIKEQEVHQGISCYFKKNKEKIYIEYKSSLVKPDDGEPYISGIGRDVTEKILSEKKVKQLQDQVAQSQKMESIGTLAGGIAHDFNNILFPILGYAEMLLEEAPENTPLRAGLNGIYTSALRAKDLVKQILTFSRQDTSESKFMKMQPIIREALKLIRSTIPATIEIIQDIDDDCGVIKADPTQIHQIVMNLSTNAYHAMEETGGKLKVSLKEIELEKSDLINSDMAPGRYACLTIADTGTGMDKAVIGKIFDPFFTTKEIGKGTGMGLSVVHGIVKNMNGDIQVVSLPGKGTKFNVFFPVEKIFFEEPKFQTEKPIQGGKERILLVDDEEAILTMEKRMLERLGYQVICRTSSFEALEAFKANPDKFDLVITDMAMPNMPGDKLSAELIKIRVDIPVLLCTGFSEAMSEEKAESIGIKGFLLKPIVMKDLDQKIREVLVGK